MTIRQRKARRLGTGLVAKIFLAGDQKAHHLALGDHDAEAAQQRKDARHRGLSLVIEHQREAAQFWPEMAIDAPGSGAVMISPSGVRQRSQRKFTTCARITRSCAT
jgi:hypothetical protein